MVTVLPSREKVFEKILKAIEKVIALREGERETITEATRFIEDLDADSLDLV